MSLRRTTPTFSQRPTQAAEQYPPQLVQAIVDGLINKADLNIYQTVVTWNNGQKNLGATTSNGDNFTIAQCGCLQIPQQFLAKDLVIALCVEHGPGTSGTTSGFS